MLDQIDSQSPSDYAFASRVFSMPEYLIDFSGLSETIKVPALVFSGKRDFAIGVEHYKIFRFPNQKMVFFEKGHIAYFEENQLLKSELIAFRNQN